MVATTAMPLRDHLADLRKRVVRAALAILIGMVAVWTSFPTIFSAIEKPFTEVQRTHPNAFLAYTGVTTGFSMQLRVSMAAAVVLTSPVWIYQIWRFVSPGLHRNERKWAYLFTSIAVPLFLTGVWLAYLVMPRMLDVLFSFTPGSVENVTSVDTYLSFFFHLTLFFGLGFLLPLFLVMLNFAGLLSSRRIALSWRWLVLGAFVFGAVATPSGDPINMTLVALPVLVLTALAWGVTWLHDRRKPKQQWADDEASSIDPAMPV